MTLTPGERNRLRHLRDLLDGYERQPAVNVATTIARAANELADEARKGAEARQIETNERVAAALREAGLS